MLSHDDCENIMAIVVPMAQTLSAGRNVILEFSKKMPVGVGGTKRFDAQKAIDLSLLDRRHDKPSLVFWPDSSEHAHPDYIVRIGISDFDSVPRRCLLSYSSALSSTLICVAHEMRHVEQYCVARGVATEDLGVSAEVVRSLVMSCGNLRFSGKNYRQLPHEIDAERIGVLSAYSFLCELHDQSFATESVSRALTRSFVLGIGPMRSGFLLRSFDAESFSEHAADAFDKALLCNRRKVKSLVSHVGSSGDFAALYFDRNPSDVPVFMSLANGFEQDAYLAMISLKYHPKDSEFFDVGALQYPDTVPVPDGISPIRSIAVVTSLECNRERRLSRMSRLRALSHSDADEGKSADSDFEM